MSKYIDKEVLIERMNRTRPYEGEDGSFERHRRLQWLADMGQINMCPAADVAEVRHGRWEYTKELYRDPNGNHLFYGKICSECNSVSPYDSPYCMNCGANMQQGVTLVGAKMDEVEA